MSFPGGGGIMAKWRCSLCGGRLSEGRCTLCGLDNTIYKREIAYSEVRHRRKAGREQKQHIKAQSQKQTRRPEQHGRKKHQTQESIVRLQLQPADPVTETGPGRQRSTAASAQHTKQKSRGAGRVHSANNKQNKKRTSCSYRYSADYTVLVPACGNRSRTVSHTGCFFRSGSVFDTYFSDSYDEEDSDYDPYCM